MSQARVAVCVTTSILAAAMLTRLTLPTRAQSIPRAAFTQPGYVADEVTPPGVPRRLEVQLTGGATSSGPMSVTVKVRGGTATLGADYTFAADSVRDHVVLDWSAGDRTAKLVEYRIVDDGLSETGEEIQFELTDPHGADIDAAAARTRTWIYDDDGPGAPVLRKASGHDMVYYLSLPPTQDPGQSVPVVVAVDGAGGWYRGMDETFRTARGDQAVTIVTPITRSNGAPWSALAEYYPADIAGDAARFAFDEAGLLAIWDDLRAAGIASGDRFYLTGHSGGGLLAYRMIFHHPELLAAAAPACPNFWPSAVDHIAIHRARATLPITVYQGQDDPYLAGHMEPQWRLAERWLADNDYRAVQRQLLAGGHEPFAEHVLAFFAAHPVESSPSGGPCYLPFGLRLAVSR